MDAKQLIIKKVDELRDEIVEFHRALVRIPSRNPPGEYQRISEFLIQELQRFGMTVKIEGPSPSKPNIIATMGGTVGRPILIFSSHMDTVPEGVGWTYNPFEAVVEDGKIFGRGAYDPYARLCVYVMAARVIREAGLKLKGDLVNVITVDEESGGADGAGYLVGNKLVTGDMVIGEAPHNIISIQECGYMHLEVAAYGKTVHAREPWHGVNAINHMAKLVVEIERYQKELSEKRSTVPGLHYTTVTVGTIHGGTRVSMTPAECTIALDIRVIPEMTNEDVLNGVRTIIHRLASEDPDFKVEVRELADVEGTGTQLDTPMIPAIKRVCQEVAGFEPPVVGTPGGATDRRFFRKAGIPAVAWGAGRSPENRPHGIDEFIEIDTLVTFTKASALVACELLGVDG